MGKTKKDSLGDRMKGNYENRSKTYLTRRTPCIIRLDGKAFHSFTKGLKRPYDSVFHKTMNSTLLYLCKNIQGCKFGYTQSDEITLVLTDFDTITTDAWFDYSVQKICSISASMATLAFNRYFKQYAEEAIDAICAMQDQDIEAKYLATLNKCLESGALFDSRCFSIPEDEVANCLIWRQQDATRNAIQMLGQTYFSHNQLDKKSCAEIQEMLWQEKGINFNDMPAEFKRGVCCIKNTTSEPMTSTKGTVVGAAIRTAWEIDTKIPIFTQDRSYVENRILIKNFITEVG